MSLSIELTTKNFAEASKIAGKNEFRFIIGNEEIFCHKFLAAFLSRSVSQALQCDPTADTFTLDISSDGSEEQKLSKEEKMKSLLSNLMNGNPVEISSEEVGQFIESLDSVTSSTKKSNVTVTKIYILIEMSERLNNDELKSEIYRSLFEIITKAENDGQKSKKEQIESTLERIQKVENLIKLFENGQCDFLSSAQRYVRDKYDEVIDDVSSHIFEIDDKYLREMSDTLIDSILSSPKLQIKSEDWLLQMLLNRRSCILSNREDGETGSERQFFIERVQFEYLSSESIKLFNREICLEDISEATWRSIKKRLVLPVQTKVSNSRQSKPPGVTFSYDSQNPFSGIFHHLTTKTNGNIQTNQTIEIKCSYLCCGQYETLVDFNDSKGYTHVYGSPTPRWLQIDFKTRKIQLNSYLIKSANNNTYNTIRALKSWKIEASLDGSSWKMIDKRDNVPDLNGDDKMQVFNINNKHEPFRFMRIITDQDNWYNSDGFVISKLELFGNLIESE